MDATEAADDHNESEVPVVGEILVEESTLDGVMFEGIVSVGHLFGDLGHPILIPSR